MSTPGVKRWALGLVFGFLLLGAVASAGLNGCGAVGGGASGDGAPGGGASGGGQTSLRARIAQAQRTHEFPAPPPPAERVGGGSASAVAAIRSFVMAYVNWNARTVSGDMRRLAGHSIGQARSALELAAAQTAGDYELKQGGVANRGTVEAVAPFRGHFDQFVVVTREQTTASNPTLYQGLRPAWHVAIATVRQVHPGVWALSGWQPQN